MNAIKDDPVLLYATGIDSVDEILGGGIARGEMCVVGARPSHGKTLFLLQWCYEAAYQKHQCLFISEEMTKEAIASRAIQFASSIPGDQWLDRWDRVFDDAVAFFDLRRPILLTDACRTVENAVQAIGEAAQHHGVRFVCVDYLQKLRGRGGNEYERLSDVSDQLKAAALEHDVALVVAAQLNRESEKRDKFLPKLYDLKGCGGIEQDADVVLFPIWPWKINPEGDADPKAYRMFCGKNRNRGIRGRGFTELSFDAERQQISERPVTQHPNYEPAFERLPYADNELE